MITINEILIESCIDIKKVLNVTMKAKINNHTKVDVIVELSEKESNKIYSLKFGEPLKLYTTNTIVFEGYIESINIKEKNKYFTANITCWSNTNKTDYIKHNQSFQNTNKTYVDLIEKVHSKTDNVSILCGKETKQNLEVPVLQYSETDWNFTLRMASKLQTIVIPSYHSNSVDFYFGIPRNNILNINISKYSRGRNSLNFIDQKTNIDKYSPYDYEYYVFENNEILKLGDWVSINNKEHMISSHNLSTEGSIIQNIYIATNPVNNLKQYQENTKIPGLSLLGTVLDTNASNIKIHLDIDKKQNKETAYWFPYLPNSGNVMYTMPELGTKVFLRYKSSKDGDAVVTSCFRTNGESNSEMKDVNDKYYTTKFNKRLAMLPDNTYLTNNETKLTLKDSKGINFQTINDIQVHVSGNISINSSQSIKMITPSKINLVKSDTESAIELSHGEILLQNKTTKISSDGNMKSIPYPIKDETKSMTMSSNIANMIVGSIPV